jgi:predicted Zn-dependent protease
VLTTVPLVDRTRFDIQGVADHGLWHLYNGRFDEARCLLNGLVSRHSGASIGYNSLGQVVMRQGEVLKAVDLFVKAGKIDPQEGAYHINLGGAYYALGQTEAAIREFEAGKARAPLNVRVDRFLDWAYELQEMERTDRFSYCMTVAQNLVFFRDYATAIGFLVQAKALRPDSKDPLNALQSVYYRMGDKKQALETMYESLRRFPDETSYLKGMGMLYNELGVPDSARLYLEPYVRRVPADAQAQAVLQMLSQCK